MRILTTTLIAVLISVYAQADVFENQGDFEAELDSVTLIDTSQYIGITTFQISPLIPGATFFGPDALVRNDDLILNGQGFHGVATPSVGINFSVPVTAVGVTSNAIDGGAIELYSGPDGTGTLLSATPFGGGNLESFTGVTGVALVGSVVFTCEFDADLRCGLRDPVFGASGVVADADMDGVPDASDNCSLRPNPSQIDTDSDLFGNACDADFNNDGSTNFLDFVQLSSAFLSTDALFDLNGDGSVNFLDIAIFSELFLTPPGPGAEGATYAVDVQPVLEDKCQPCHTSLGFGGHNIAVNYSDHLLAATSAPCTGLSVGECSLIRVRSGSMPQGAGCTGDPTTDAGNVSCLNYDEQLALSSWINGGFAP